jgi:hypothetical protein
MPISTHFMDLICPGIHLYIMLHTFQGAGIDNGKGKGKGKDNGKGGEL